MDGQFLIPANASRGKLILGYFRPIDLVIFLTGIFITFILLLMFQDYTSNTVVTVLIILPAAICLFLVVPIPNQHNVLVFLQEMYRYYFVNRQKYFWRGWCRDYGDKQ